ncbi:MAG TPA: Uma2 family endonuclease [Candidatus Limnocylindria bacterium]|nr:Uma2 family endonuclease [Candidatus Limnocylindria bacterium]
MAALSPRTFTVDEYHRIADLGIFEDERVELLDGLIVEMSPIGTRHWRRHARIVAYLNEHLGTHALIVGQGSLPRAIRSRWRGYRASRSTRKGSWNEKRARHRCRAPLVLVVTRARR